MLWHTPEDQRTRSLLLLPSYRGGMWRCVIGARRVCLAARPGQQITTAELERGWLKAFCTTAQPYLESLL